MLNSAQGRTLAGTLRVLRTDGGPHSTTSWAEMLSDRLIELGPQLQGDRLKAALAVKNNVTNVLGNAYDRLKNDITIGRNTDLSPMAREVVVEVGRTLKGTDWAMAFDDLTLRQQMYDEVLRSMKTIVVIELQMKGAA